MSKKKNTAEYNTSENIVTSVADDFMPEPLIEDTIEYTPAEDDVIFNNTQETAEVKSVKEEPKKVVEKTTRTVMQFTPMGPRIVEI